ncbi:universal stress protein [Sediminicola sp. 1XM1-17]|uniref:universal stress protein n=1 Tax=Sediminicola sp. 1XM1-17 TaxID=3127702 RepID=UPI003076C530
MKNILIPTDFSDNAWNAIFCVLKLYRDVECTFYLLHTYEVSASQIKGARDSQKAGKLYEVLAMESEKGLMETQTYLERNHKNPKHTFMTLSKPDHLVGAIKDILQEKSIKLVAMGTLGATGAKEVFMGSNTVRVIKAIRNCSILAVPEEFNFQQLTTIVFPTDYSRFYYSFELLPLAELAMTWQTAVHVFHVALEVELNKEQRSNQEILTERLKGVNLIFQEKNIHDTITESIVEFSTDLNADMVALIHYQHTFLEKLTREPVVKKVGFHSRVPLLVLPELS